MNKTIKEISKTITYDEGIRNIGKSVPDKEPIERMKNTCSHDIVLLVGNGQEKAYYCLECGKIEYVFDNVKGRPYEGGVVLDFRGNTLGWGLVIEDTLLVKAMKKLIKESATDMDVYEFIKTIPQELYTSPEAVKEILNEKVKKKD
jgi:hypothetical protein